MSRIPLRFIGFMTILVIPGMALAAGQSFADVPTQSPQYAAVEYLKEKGILQGYADLSDPSGKTQLFRPEQTVNRAEMIKIIVANRKKDTETAAASSGATFSDVPQSSWFAPFVTRAVELGIIDRPDSEKALFLPQNAVKKSEALKMLILGYGVDAAGSFGEIRYPLSADVLSPESWFYPYVRYGLTSSAVQATENMLEPEAQMTRGDVADLLYRFLLYRDGKQTQALLSSMEHDVLTALLLLENDVTDSARQAAARAVLAARGALASRPEDALSKAAVKTAEGVMALVDAQTAMSAGDNDNAVEQASTAWHLGAKAIGFSSGLKAIDLQLQSAAAQMADKARSQ